MKKFLVTFLTFIGLTMSAYAADITLGYCGGYDPMSAVKCTDKEVWVSGAIYIPASTLNTYGGNQINGIKAALKSKLNIKELKVWLRTDLDGDNIMEQSVTTESDPAISKGWNFLMFDSPWDIPADSEKGLYIGYSYFQERTTQAMGILNFPAANALYVQFGDGAWTDYSSEGTLCVEALVSGDNLPKVNLALTSLELPDVYVISDGTMEISGTVKNLATYIITGFDVNTFMDGEHVATTHIDCEIPYGGSDQFSAEVSLGITSTDQTTGTLTVTIDNINEGSDEDLSDNTLSGSFYIAKAAFERRIFVEEFTTEVCPNCPRVSTYIHAALQKDEFKDNVIVVCHHAGYYTDWLTTDFDRSYLWLYNEGGSTYAPAMTVDRRPRNDYTPVWCPTSTVDMENAWIKGLNQPAFVSLNLTAEFDQENENRIMVKVTGEKSVDNLCENPTITVYIVEDDIKAHNQSGGGNDYIHNHVNRAVNSVWGDELQFEGDEYEYTCDFELSSSWVRENLQIVAIIGNYNALSPVDCVVQNASSLPFSGIDGAGVAGVEAEDGEAEVYSISGIRMSDANLSPGLYIRKTGNKSEKFVVK